MPMITTLDYAKSCLIGSLMECIAYGLYFNLFLMCLQVMRRKQATGALPIHLVIVSFVLFILITFRLVFDNIGTVEAFTAHPTTPNAADIYFTRFSVASMLRTSPYVVLTLVADLFIVYRVYAVYGNSIRAVAGPLLIALADIVAGGLALQTVHELSVGSSPDSASVSTHLMTFYSLTLSLNIICTFLIALRIYLVKRHTDGLTTTSTNLSISMVIIVESAAIYSASLIAMIIPTALGSNVQFCILSMMPGVVGIAFSLIIIRVSSGSSTELTTGPVSVLRFARSGATSGIGDPERTRMENISMPEPDRHIQVHLGPTSRSLGAHSDIERASENEK